VMSLSPGLEGFEHPVMIAATRKSKGTAAFIKALGNS